MGLLYSSILGDNARGIYDYQVIRLYPFLTDLFKIQTWFYRNIVQLAFHCSFLFCFPLYNEKKHLLRLKNTGSCFFIFIWVYDSKLIFACSFAYKVNIKRVFLYFFIINIACLSFIAWRKNVILIIG